MEIQRNMQMRRGTVSAAPSTENYSLESTRMAEPSSIQPEGEGSLSQDPPAQSLRPVTKSLLLPFPLASTLPALTGSNASRVAPRWLTCSEGSSPRHTLFVVSSRLGKRLSRWHRWFAALSELLQEAPFPEHLFLLVPRTTACDYVARGVALFARQSIWLLEEERTRKVPPSDGMLLSNPWTVSTARTPDAVACLKTPGVTERDDFRQPPRGTWELPFRDHWGIRIAARVIVLHVRANGQIERLLKARLDSGLFPPSSISLRADDTLIPPKLRRELVGRGASVWSPMNRRWAAPAINPNSLSSIALPDRLRPSNEFNRHGIASAVRSDILMSPLECPKQDWWRGEATLIHCTRGRQGRWPDQSRNEFLAELLLHPEAYDDSPVGALTRILAQGRLLATAAGIRGGYPMISFTALPWEEVIRRRVFRPHRQRWDFEPYGLCFRRDALKARGARPVRYGDERAWERMAEEARPYFQRRWTRQRKRKGRGQGSTDTMDWSNEHEWRLFGDLILDSVSPDDLVIFVPSAPEAKKLVPVSHWPVVVIG